MKRTVKKFIKIINIDLSFMYREAPIIVFIAGSLLFGLIFIYNLGAFTGPDMRDAHYKASLALATGQSFNKPITQGYGRVSELKGNERYFNSGGDTCGKGALVSAVVAVPLNNDRLHKCIFQHDKNLSWDKTVKTTGILQYPPIGYIPQAIGIFAGIKLHLEPVHAQTLARVLNLFTYIVIIAASIKLLPKGKWLTVGLGLLPPSLFLASSLSADALNIAWSFLLIAYVLHLNHKGKLINKKQKLMLAVLGVVLFLLKVAYSPLILILLVLDKKTISYKHRWVLFAITSIVGAILYAIWSLNWSSLNSAVDLSVQSNLIIHNLPKFIIGIIVNVVYAPFFVLKINELGYLLVYGVLVFILGKNIKNKQVVVPSKLVDFVIFYKIQIVSLLAWTLSLAMTYTALLLIWTDISKYGWLGIQGFQERYLLPLLPLLILVYYLPQNTVLPLGVNIKKQANDKAGGTKPRLQRRSV